MKDVFYLSSLTLMDFKEFVINELSKPYDEQQAYLTPDPLTEKYLFFWCGQVRYLSVQVVENMLKRKQLFYYSDTVFKIKDIIVGRDFRHLVVEQERSKLKKRRWL